MSSRIDSLLPGEKIIDSDGVASRNFSILIQRLADQVNLNTPLKGSGNPEGVRTAAPSQMYWDISVTPYEEYVKTTRSTLKTGWIRVI